MKKIMVEKYKCDWCKKMFDTKNECNEHELLQHKCPTCKHGYFVYGCELTCEYENENPEYCNYEVKND